MKVYVSSSQRDLQEQRLAVIQTLRDLGYEPVAMEQYGAESRPPIAKCLQDVSECDIYLGIVAWRYGSPLEGTDASYTEMELNEAERLGIPTLPFLHDGVSPWPPAMMDEDMGPVRAFRSRLQQKLAAMFGSTDDLVTKVRASLRKSVNLNPPMVGQELARRTLRRALDNLMTHQRVQVVFVEGEVGSGKRKLIDWFRQDLLKDPSSPASSMSIFGGSYLDGLASYYRGIREVLEKLLEIDVAESRDMVRDKVAAFFATAHMKEEQAKIDGVVNFLRPESTAGPAPADAADTRRSSFFTDIALPLLRKAEKGPLLVYLENLHYAEEDSFRFLEHLLASLHDRPSKLLIVCMYDTHAKRDNPSLVAAIDRIARNYRTEVCHFVMLRRLTDDEMATLISEMLGAPLDGQDTVLAMAEGNPHHAVEIVRYLHDRDLIVHKGDRWELAEFGDLLELVPTQLNTLIENRLNAIETTHPNGKHERAVLDWAALIGQRFSTELLERAVEKQDAELAPHVLDLLEHLVDDEEIFRSSEEFGLNVLEFSQELMRRVIRAQIERKFTTPRKHRCIADTMLDLYASQVESIAHEVANHLMSAREDSRALQYLLMAARVARNGYNYADAQRHLKTALDILARSGDGADPNRQIDVMLDLGDVLIASSHFAEAIHYVQDALAHSRDANNPRAEARSLLALGNAYVRRGDQADAQGRYAECKMLVDAHPLDDLRPELLKGIASNQYRLGDLTTALATCNDWLATHTDDDLLPLRAEVLRIRGYVLLWNFSLDEALQNFTDGADLAKQLQDRQLLAYFYNNLGEIHRHQHRLDPAQELYTHSLQIREDIGDLSGVAMSRNNLGLTCKVRAEIAAANGDPAAAASHYHEARRWFDRAIKLAAEIGDNHRKADALNNLATLCRIDGQFREALAHYNEAHRLYSKGKMKNELAIVEANLAMMAHLQGDDATALAKYRDSARRFEDAGNSAYASYVYHNLAVLSQRLGESDAVPRLLERKAQGLADHPTYPWPAELQAETLSDLVNIPDI